MNVLIIGANGAIGGICKSVCTEVLGVDNLFTPHSSDVYLGNLNERLYLDSLPKIDIVVLAFGTYGGLKSYEDNSTTAQGTIVQSDLKALLLHRSCAAARVILYSSAVLENPQNLLPSSPYYSYACEKRSIEEVVKQNSTSHIIFRPTNIISRFENHDKSGHAVASIYRNIRDNAKSRSCEIWSNPGDWREFTTERLISNTLRYAISSDLEKLHYKLAFGSGYKMYMSELVNTISAILGEDYAFIRFSQPKKNGPLVDLVSIDTDFIKNGCDVDVVGELKQVINIWKKLDEERVGISYG